MIGQDKRRHFRVPVNLAVTVVDTEGRVLSGEIDDMTVYGARVVLRAHTIKRGEEIALRFLANGVPVEPRASVQGLYPGNALGVRFTVIEPLHQLHIAAMLYTRMQLLQFRPQD